MCVNVFAHPLTDLSDALIVCAIVMAFSITCVKCLQSMHSLMLCCYVLHSHPSPVYTLYM